MAIRSHHRQAWLAVHALESREVPAVFTVTSPTDSGPGSLHRPLPTRMPSPGRT